MTDVRRKRRTEAMRAEDIDPLPETTGRGGTQPRIDPNWRDPPATASPPPPASHSATADIPGVPDPRDRFSAAGEIAGASASPSPAPVRRERRRRSRTEPRLDMRGGTVPGTLAAPVSPPLQVQTLPGVVPFRAPIRGRMIANGDNGVYFVGEHIGSGAYGDVYECTDEWANPLVAKVLKPGLPFEEVQRQWQSEVSNLHQMRHPNITYIYDAFMYEDAFFIIVEKCLYSLDRVLHRADATWAPYIARDVLQALAFVHRLGHVHKDVHVGNIFVSVSSDVMDPQHMPRLQFKLGDLGIARLEHDIRTVGTILAPWMRPPEAIDPGTFGRVSKPTDIYHAALLLLAVLRREIYPFTEAEIVAGLPRDLAERTGWAGAMALSNALHPAVQRRTQSSLELWREIQAGLQGGGPAPEPAVGG
jgi:hypothetical protein